MALDHQGPPPVTAGRRWLVGTNVAVSVVIVAAIAGVVQALAYSTSVRLDMTSTGVNSLSEGTLNLLRDLKDSVRLTSLYFETDREEEDQANYRRITRDLLDLYESNNRSKITAEWINPLKDTEKLNQLVDRLRTMPAHREAIQKYQERIDEYRNKLDVELRQLIQGELDTLLGLTGAMGSDATPAQKALAPVDRFFHEILQRLTNTRDQVEALTAGATLDLTSASQELQGLYRTISKAMKDISAYAAEQAGQVSGLSQAQLMFLREAGSRYGELLSAVDQEQSALQSLEPLKVDELVGQLGPTSNAVLVETDRDTRVVDFSSMWPLRDEQRSSGRGRFKDRAFKGEEKLTSAILRATHQQQTAVIFVRYGGMPLFLGGFMPNQPPAPYTAMKTKLEEANFIVQEWDLKSSDQPPTVTPTPTRTIYVVLKPSAPERGPMGQPSPDPPFGDNHRQAVLGALGEHGRALFIAGWTPGPFGPIPSSYEYADYLKNTWGIELDPSALLIEFTSLRPGQYGVTRRDFFNMDEVEVGAHPIVSGGHARQLGLPWCAPLVLPASPTEGVTYTPLVIQPKRDGVWGVKNIQRYEDQMRERQYVIRVPDDLEGPFTLAVAAAKGEAKVVVVGSREFATDQVAFAQNLGIGPQGGLVLYSKNPGNVSLLVNSLYWLDDNMQFMNIGKPIDISVLQIPSPTTERLVRTIAIVAWPAVALLCGGAVWWIRRR